jgi:hypothetical protein
MNFILPIAGLIAAVTMLWVSLWQIEIVSWNKDEYFEFPFFLLRVNKWTARDFWYLINVSGFILAAASGYFLAMA